MEVQILFLLLIASGLSLPEKEIRSEIEAQDDIPCKPHENLVKEFRNSFYKYLVDIYKQISAHSKMNFVFSANALWLALAGMAEGADSLTRQQLFQFLHLPEDWCLRREYYKLARDDILPGKGVSIRRLSVLAVDESLSVNTQWENLIYEHTPLRILDLPIKSDPELSIKVMERLMSVPLKGLNLTGNSVLFDAVDYEGLWRTAFADASIERSPFYNLKGEQIGYVDLMKIKKPVRMIYIPSVKAMNIELPVGSDRRYRMIFSMFDPSVDVMSTVMNISAEMLSYMVDNLQETDEPVDVRIPRIGVTSRIDVRQILEGVGINRLWAEEAATRFISEAAALPSSFVQRASLSLNTEGVEASNEQNTSSRTVRKDFVANRPFLFALFDAETDTCLLAAGYSTPTYPNPE